MPLKDIHIDEGGFRQWVKNGEAMTEYITKYVKK
jgi:hypothetical protein